MSNHTPGPWQARGSHIASDFGIVVEGKFVIAEVFSDIRQAAKIDVEEARANARLIAAAPNLLEVLRQIVEQHGQWNNGIWAANIARAAIAKATGEQHE